MTHKKLNLPHESVLTLTKTIKDEDEQVSRLYRDVQFKLETFKNISFETCIFSGVTFHGIIGKFVRFYNVRFINCDFSNCDLTGLYADSCEFIECRITGTKFIEALIKFTRFKDCTGEYMLTTLTKTKEIIFEHCFLKSSIFQDCDLQKALFVNCDLTEAEFSHSKLKEADIRGSIIDKARLGLEEIQGLIADPGQAIYIAAILGLKIQ